MTQEVYNTDLWCPRGSLSIPQVQKLKELISQFNPTYSIETGFCTGRSSATLLYYSNVQKHISIDYDLNYIAPDGLIYKNILQNQYPNFQVIQQNSHDLLTPSFLSSNYNHGIDWAYIDGDQSYIGILQDLYAIHDFINTNGIIIINNYNYSFGPINTQLNDACNNFYSNNQQFYNKEIWKVDYYGYMILIKK